MHSKRALINSAVMMLYEVISTICGLILPRIILLRFGSEINGAVASINQFISFISVLRLGVAGATRVALYRSLAKHDINKTSAIVKATEQYMRKVGIALIGYIAILTFVLPYFLKTGLSYYDTGLLVIIIGIGTFANYFFGITYQTLLDSDQNEYLYYIIQTITIVLNTLIGVKLCDLGCSIHLVKLATSILFFLNPLCLSLIVRSKYKINKNVEPDYEAIKNRKSVMTQSIANIVHANTDVTVLTLLSDIKNVSIYSVYYMVIGMLNKLLSVFTTSLEAAFGNLFANNDKNRIKKNFEAYEFFISAFVSVVTPCSICLILPFVNLYTNNVVDADYYQPAFAMLAILAQMMQCFRQPYRTLVQAAGKYKETERASIIEAVLNVFISVLFVYRFGLIGVTIGTFVANTYRTIDYIYYVNNELIQRKNKASIQYIMWGLFNSSAIILLYHISLKNIRIASWVNWVFVAALLTISSLAIVFLSSFVFYRNNIAYLKEKVNVILKNRKS